MNFDIEDYTNNLKWIAATEHEKTLVICNLRTLYSVLSRQHEQAISQAEARTLAVVSDYLDEVADGNAGDVHDLLHRLARTIRNLQPPATADESLKKLLLRVAHKVWQECAAGNRPSNADLERIVDDELAR